MEQLLQKLMISKQIMDKHNTMNRGNASPSVNLTPQMDSYDIPQAKYNIPQEFLQEAQQQVQPRASVPSGPPTVEAIKKSKLPDEIKRLMIEHPIEKPQQATATLSDDLIEKASRLMKGQSNNYVPEGAKPKVQESAKPAISNNTDLKKMIKEAVEETLRENGMLTESTEKSNEVFSFRVGKHIFEGKVTKIKKIS